MSHCLAIISLTCFLAAIPCHVGAQDHRAHELVAEMELEITIREISKETRDNALELARASVKKTTLYARYKRADEDRKTAVPEELAKAVDKARAAWKKASAEQAARTRRALTLAEMQEALAYRQDDELWDKLRKLLDEQNRISTEAFERFSALADEVNSLVDHFARKIYRREMKKRLIELKIKITEKVLKEIEHSYQRHEA